MMIDLAFLRSVWSPASSQGRRVLVVNGHPDPRPERFCAALCDAFAEGAMESGRQVRYLEVGDAATAKDWDAAFERLWWSDRLFVAYPMWMGRPPPVLQRLFDDFAAKTSSSETLWKTRAPHVVVTASLPSLLYRKKSIGSETSSLVLPALAGLEAARTTLIGSVDKIASGDRLRWIEEMRALGAQTNRVFP